MNEARRLGSKAWVSIGVGAVAIGAAIALLVRDRGAIRSLTEVDWRLLAAIGALQVVNAGSDAIRYRMPWPDRYRRAVHAGEWMEVFMVGRLMNMFVPQSGTAYRSVRLKSRIGLPVSSYLGSVFLITWVGNAVAALLAALLVLWSGRSLLALALVAVAGAISAVVVLVGLMPQIDARAVNRIPRRLAGLLERLTESFVELDRDRPRAARVLATSLITQVTGLLAYVFTVQALGVQEPWVVGGVLYAGTTIATVVSLSPGGLGITELAAAGAGLLVDATAGVGVAAALVIRATGTIAVVILAAVGVIAHHVRRSAVT